MLRIVVAWIGASSSIGTQPPLLGPVLPSGTVSYREGVLQTQLSAQNSGAQSTFLDCMHQHGFDVTLVERGRVSATLSTLMDARDPALAPMELLVSDLDGLGLDADVLIMIGAGPDAKRQDDAATYSERLWGPWTVSGPGSLDISIMGQARAAWGDSIPLVLTTPTNWNGGDPLIGLAPNETHHWHQDVRAAGLTGCARDRRCRPVLTTQADVPLDPEDGHPTTAGYGMMGTGICQAALELL